MRLGLLLYGLDGTFGGIGRYSVELARALSQSEHGIDLTLLTTGRALDPSYAGRSRQVRLPGCRLLPGLITLGNLAIPAISRAENLSLVHDPTGVSPFMLGAAGAKTVVTLHDTFPLAFPGTSTFLDTVIHRHWLPRVLPRVDAIVTVSESSKRDIVRYLKVSAAKVHVTSEGVNPIYQPVSRETVARTRTRYGLPPSYILFVGSVERRKNLRSLLLACARSGGEASGVPSSSPARGSPGMQYSSRAFARRTWSVT
jgi:glycosyltransferase involved in cell wall biosynthesis